MPLDLAALQAELFARGFDYLNDGGSGLTRAKRLLNDAMHAIDDLGDWPYLNASTTGTAPMTIADLRKVETVADTARDVPLTQRARAELLDAFGDLTIPGSPSEFYVTAGTTINVFPVSTTAPLQVLYWKITPDMAAGTDVPLMPDRFRMAIVEYAVGIAMRDEDPAQAQIANQAGDLIVQRMRDWAGDLQPAATYRPPIGDDG